MADDTLKQPPVPADPKRSYVEMAKERNARVILCHTPDAYMLTDLTRAIDRGLRYLRDQVFTMLPLETVEPLFKEYCENVLSLYETVVKICEAVNIDYKPSRSLAKWLEAQGVKIPAVHKDAAKKAKDNLI